MNIIEILMGFHECFVCGNIVKELKGFDCVCSKECFITETKKYINDDLEVKK